MANSNIYEYFIIPTTTATDTVTYTTTTTSDYIMKSVPIKIKAKVTEYLTDEMLKYIGMKRIVKPNPQDYKTDFDYVKAIKEYASLY